MSSRAAGEGRGQFYHRDGGKTSQGRGDQAYTSHEDWVECRLFQAEASAGEKA